MNTIPKIIHQIWGGANPLPEYFTILSETWIKNLPGWKYEFWDDDRIDKFVQEQYPEYVEMFRGFTYNMQRWDTIRYLILNKIGGVYTDFDSECLKPLDQLMEGKECWFALEPVEYAKRNKKDPLLSTALVGSTPNHPFIQQVIKEIFTDFKHTAFTTIIGKINDTINSTGPLKITDVYEKYPNKNEVCLMPHKYIAAYTSDETKRILLEEFESEELEKRIEEAYAVHYFFNAWIKGKE